VILRDGDISLQVVIAMITSMYITTGGERLKGSAWASCYYKFATFNFQRSQTHNEEYGNLCGGLTIFCDVITNRAAIYQ
jgi:hypothetical protein